jgi:hypothetical protein
MMNYNLSDYAKAFHGYGFNLTAIRPENKKRPLGGWKQLLTERQDLKEINAHDWARCSGVGGVTGVNNIRCIDIDGAEDNRGVAHLLTRLGLGENYEWVVKSGSGRGYHIWVTSESFPAEYAFNSQVQDFKALSGRGFGHLELRWNQHIVLPPSEHESGGWYSFSNCKFPSAAPSEVDANDIIRAVLEICEDPNRGRIKPAAAPVLVSRGSEAGQDLFGRVEEINGCFDYLSYAALHLPGGGIQRQEGAEIRIGESGAGYGTILYNPRKKMWTHPQTAFAGGKALQMVAYKITGRPDNGELKGALFCQVFNEAAEFCGLPPLPPPLKPTEPTKPGKNKPAAGRARAGGGRKRKGGSVFDQAGDYLEECYQLVRNEITGRIEAQGSPLTEQEINSIYIDLYRVVDIKKPDFETLLNSCEIPSYNPIIRFFEEHKHIRETGLISQLSYCLNCTTGFTGDNSEFEYAEKFLKKWLVGMVASVYPGKYNPLMIVLVGGVNVGKTEFFRRLLPDELKGYFAQSKFSEGKDSEALMCEMLLILNDELDGLHKSEAQTFRNLISSNKFTYRPPYGRQNVTRDRIASVCGTSNYKNIIVDSENNRRIIPFELTDIDHTRYNSIDKTALVMEAWHLFKSGYDYGLTREEIQILRNCTAEYKAMELETDLLLKYFTPGNFEDTAGSQLLTAGEIKSFIETATKQRLSLPTLGKAMKAAGFTCKTVKVRGTRTTKQVYSVREVLTSTTSY